MAIEERLLKLERESRFLRTLVATFGGIAALWLCVVTALAVVGLMPEKREPAPVAVAPPPFKPEENAIRGDVTFGTLRCERLEVGDIGESTPGQPALFIADEMPGGEAMRLTIRNRDETSVVLLEAWKGTAHVGLQADDKTQSIAVP